MKALIFDFDGVIVTTSDFSYDILHEIKPSLSKERFLRMFDGNVNHGLQRENITSKLLINYFFGKYSTKIMKVDPVAKIDRVIRKTSESCTLFIVSASLTFIINEYLEKNNLRRYFEDILGNDIAYSKTEKINSILEKYTPEDCLFITDTLGDILEGKKSKVKTIGVTWGYHDRGSIERGNPDSIVTNPKELLEKLQSSFL